MTLEGALAMLAVVVAVTCAVPGTLLVVRRQSMLVDAVSHAVFPGIVVGALVSGSTRSPWLVVLAMVFGLAVVLGAERLRTSGLVTGEASQGMVYPVLFSVGIALLSTRMTGVHLSESTVLAGEMNLMALPSERVVVAGYDLGPEAACWLLAVLVVDVLFIAVTYRVLATSAFDPQLART